jgi:hypothetical protein
MTKNDEKEVETTEARRPDYTDKRVTNGGRGRVDLAVWVNETERGLRFGTQLKFQYRPQNGNWKDLENPMSEQWLDGAKILEDADTWKQGYLRQRRNAEREAEA